MAEVQPLKRDRILLQDVESQDLLHQHNVNLRQGQVELRPLTENDWGLLLKWNSDPEVLHYAEGDDVESYSLPQVQAIYRTVSQNAYCFMIGFADEPIGECWLQRMNLERILARYPGLDCRRIDLVIGEKRFRNRGIGTEVIRMLVEFGFRQGNAEVVFGCDIADYNLASLRAFEKAGFAADAEYNEPPGRKARRVFDLRLSKQQLADNGRNQEQAPHFGKLGTSHIVHRCIVQRHYVSNDER